jgi:hypothetical protein
MADIAEKIYVEILNAIRTISITKLGKKRKKKGLVKKDVIETSIS